jgi:hypothetical protein
VKDGFERAQSPARYDEELERWFARHEIFDAHVHYGRDIDGFVADYADPSSHGRSGATRAFCFCLDEPDRIRL